MSKDPALCSVIAARSALLCPRAASASIRDALAAASMSLAAVRIRGIARSTTSAPVRSKFETSADVTTGGTRRTIGGGGVCVCVCVRVSVPAAAGAVAVACAAATPPTSGDASARFASTTTRGADVGGGIIPGSGSGRRAKGACGACVPLPESWHAAHRS